MNTIDTLSEELLKEFSFFKKTPPAVINKEFLNKIKNEKLKKKKVILNNCPLKEIYDTYIDVNGIKNEKEIDVRFERLGPIYENWYAIGGNRKKLLSIDTTSIIDLVEKYLELDKNLRNMDILNKTYKLWEKMNRNDINKLIVKQYDGNTSSKNKAYENLEYFFPQYISDIINAPVMYMMLFREAVVDYKNSLEEVIRRLYPLT